MRSFRSPFAFVPNLSVTTDAGPKAQPTLSLVDTTQSGSAPTPSPPGVSTCAPLAAPN